MFPSWGGGRGGIRERGITISEQNAIPARSQWGWQRALMLWICQTSGVLAKRVNVWLSQSIACNYGFNTRENLLSTPMGFFHSLFLYTLFLHSLGHTQLCPLQLPHRSHMGQGALPLSSLYLYYPLLHYNFFTTINVCPSSALHFLLVFATLCSG